LVNPIIGLIVLVTFYLFARRFYSESVAFWSLTVMALCGYLIFNAASYFSHLSCMLMVIAFVWLMRLYMARPDKMIYAVLAGFFLGVVIVIRYYTALLIFLPFALYLVYHLRAKAFRPFIYIALGSLPCILFLFWYNNAITGNPLVPVTVWGFEDEKLGFVRGHTILKGIEHFIRRIFMFFYWSSPGLLILYFILLWTKVRSKTERWLHPEDYFFITLFLGHYFYYQIGGNQYGPRFMVEALPFLTLFVIQGVFRFRSAGMLALLFAGLIFAIVKFPFIAAREARIVDERQDIYDQVENRKLHNAVVFVTDPTSTIRPMPVGDLTRNDVEFKNDVIYAQEFPEWNRQLRAFYKDRSFYRYIRDVNNPDGTLVRIR
jgi:4-amino-4-deoxy-L-arabinose transferase-like glycosyltransferase